MQVRHCFISDKINRGQRKRNDRLLHETIRSRRPIKKVGIQKTAVPNRTGLCNIVERVGGIEPPSSAWKAEVIPVYDTRVAYLYLTVVPYFLQAKPRS